MKVENIKTNRLILRSWTEDDIKSFAEMNLDTDVMKYFPKTLSYDETVESVQRIIKHFDNYGFGLYAVEEKISHTFIGFTGFAIPTFETDFTPCIEIGWRYKKEYWGNGFATEAALACLQHGFENLNFKKVVSFTAAINKKSENVMQRIGMQYVKDFYHPKIETENILCRHVLYELKEEEYFNR
ncbi:MAG: GNAT family N-acetyltransferase [Chitinophagaceae bacterium]